MVTIYALIDPRNNEPFYIGASKNTKSRLSGHVCDITNGGKERNTYLRHQLMQQIINDGYKTEIIPLLICSIKAVTKCEKHIYQLLIDNGYKLLQSSNRFNWDNSSR